MTTAVSTCTKANKSHRGPKLIPEETMKDKKNRDRNNNLYSHVAMFHAEASGPLVIVVAVWYT